MMVSLLIPQNGGAAATQSRCEVGQSSVATVVHTRPAPIAWLALRWRSLAEAWNEQQGQADLTHANRRTFVMARNPSRSDERDHGAA